MTRWRRLLVAGILLSTLSTQPLQVLAQSTNQATSSASNGPYSTEKTGDTISIEVPDCPGLSRDIDAHKVPPSIYPKPCGATASATGPLGSATGQYGTGTGKPAAGTLFWVINGNDPSVNITQGFGLTDWAANSEYGQTAYQYCTDMGVPGHCAVDLGVSYLTKLYTPVAGTVTIAGGTGFYCDSDDGGNGCGAGVGELAIEMSNGDILILGHMRRIEVNVGQTVTAGQYVGVSGGENGAHVHIEYRQAGHSENPSGFQVLDPREVFSVPAGSAPSGGSSAPSTNPPAVSTGTGSTSANSMSYFQQKYGFVAPSGDVFSERIAANQANFTILRDWAIKAAPLVKIEPEMIVWWSIVETSEPYDSYSYNNCGDYSNVVDMNCPAVYSGGWQIGYGQQYVFGSGILDDAFQGMRGSPADAALVQRLGQEVLTKAGISGKTFPSQNIAQLIANGSFSSEAAGNYWLYTIMRDPAVSAYLLGGELAADTGGGGDFMAKMCTWGSYYCDPANIQMFADGLNDVIKAWGVAGSGSSATCTTGNPLGGSTGCSTEADSFNGMDLNEFVQKINENMADYKQIADCADVPWEMMAAIHHRETALLRNYTGNNGGPWQIDPPKPDVDEFNFVEAGCDAAKSLQGKAADAPLNGKLRATMDPNNKADADIIKFAFFGYNGRGGFQSNIDKGKCTEVAGGASLNWDCSAYVMNNWDAQHTDMCIHGTIDGGAEGDFCDGIDGAWKTYYKLVFSTYDGNGKLLVYGGKCQEANDTTTTTNPDGSTAGTSLPTDSARAITNQFFVGGIGVTIANNLNDPVYAIANGQVVASGWTFPGPGQTSSPTGYYVILQVKGPGGDRWVFYGNLAAEDRVAVGATVTAGQKIGKTGNTMVLDPRGVLSRNGVTTTPHLQFDIRTVQGGGPSIALHVNPCTVPGFNQYTSLTCPGKQGGATW